MEEKCAIYIRTSIDNEEFLKQKRKELIDYCENILKIDNYEIFEEIASVFNRRETLDKMMERIEGKEFTDMLVSSTNQIERNAQKCIKYLEQICEEVELHSVTEPEFDINTAKIVINDMIQRLEYKKSNIKDKVINDLIANLGKIDLRKLDIDGILDNRDTSEFANEWMRVQDEIERIKEGENFNTENKDNSSYIRQEVAGIVYELAGGIELAEEIGDDFELIAESRLVGYSDQWLDKLISCYKNSTIPTGIL